MCPNCRNYRDKYKLNIKKGIRNDCATFGCKAREPKNRLIYYPEGQCEFFTPKKEIYKDEIKFKKG